ncbi:MAG TPA: glycosyltransferase family 4 protein [Planctomycetota bacterium]|nr:glycosyltransferase family 4 protein [Planctomycetota bacterium]
MKKLCFICEATEGGVRKHLRDLIRVFSRPGEGFEIHAILGDRGEPGLREELNAMPLQHTFVPQFQRSISSLRDTRAYMHIKELLRKIQPDIVHTHSAKAGFLGRYAAHHLGIKKILHTPHVFPFQWAHGFQARVYLALEKQVARFSHTLICVGESQREDALARKVAEAEKLVVVRNGIELPPESAAAERERARSNARRALEIADDQPAIGMVARLAPQKGVGAFVRSAALILEKNPRCVFFMIGGGPLEGEVRARMAELGVGQEKFRLLGHRQDAPRLYPGFDVAVLSSLYEGLPYVLLEAMAWGVPIVATDVLGSRDVVVDGETGFLARVNDPKHIAERTLLLLEDAPLRKRYGSAAQKRVAEEFSFAKFIEGHRALYNG